MENGELRCLCLQVTRCMLHVFDAYIFLLTCHLKLVMHRVTFKWHPMITIN
jgi:hypothetical protein